MGFEAASVAALGGSSRGIVERDRRAVRSGRGPLLTAAVLIAGLLVSVVGLAAPAAATGSTPQTISFGALPGHVYGDAPFTVSATASSGLTVTFSHRQLVGGLRFQRDERLDDHDRRSWDLHRAGGSGRQRPYAAASSVDQAFSVTAADVDLRFQHSRNQLGSGRTELQAELSPTVATGRRRHIGLAVDLLGLGGKHRLFPRGRHVQAYGARHGHQPISGRDRSQSDLHCLQSRRSQVHQVMGKGGQRQLVQCEQLVARWGTEQQ